MYSTRLSLSVQVFVNEVNTHREQVLALEKAGSQLRFASLKQDVVLIKNLLLSVQARWDKLVQKSLDRGRHLDEARKRAKQVLNRLLCSKVFCLSSKRCNKYTT